MPRTRAEMQAGVGFWREPSSNGSSPANRDFYQSGGIGRPSEVKERPRRYRKRKAKVGTEPLVEGT